MSAAIENTNTSESATAAAPVVMSLEQIMELFKAQRTQLAELEKAVKVAMKAKGKRGAAKAADKPKRAAGPWALWAKQMPLDHPEDFASFKAEKEAEASAEGKKAKGVHILFAKMWRDSHTDEWDAFSAKVKADMPPKAEKPAAKPKAEKAEKPKADKKAAAAAKPKAKAEKPAAKSKAEKPAKKSAPAPTPAAEEDEVSAELWTWKGKKYFRTSSNECWLAEADGSMGKWAGIYDPVADDIDTDAEEPEVEME